MTVRGGGSFGSSGMSESCDGKILIKCQSLSCYLVKDDLANVAEYKGNFGRRSSFTHPDGLCLILS